MDEKLLRHKRVTSILFIVYFLLLTWIIVFKMELSMSNLVAERSINFIPFKESAIVNGRISFSEIINNAIVFIPVGVFTAMLADNLKFIKMAAVPFGISLFYEITQYIFAVGACDITDLINNTLGGIVGILIFKLRRKVLGDKAYKVVNIFSIMCVVLIVIMIGALIFLN
ncbi:VanZ family protein [Peptacetobacter sp.]|uniref:VanZ family protein n=1 Tax=Peptacetobacter sp. TaxID=2991975 RepID=UPI002E7A8BB2|nr:VanZ family protein [Peptacetobacter sp.]MEE0451883.1 VanZ family protein [Peptacetobacter sp.]